jgi:4-amino-4-deoxy-L-arabinose transferase-like glycosyltransferase
VVDRSAGHRIAAAAARVSTTARVLILAVAVRVAYLGIGIERPETQLYDWAYFRGAAAGLATGKGFVQPVMYSPVVLTANEPSAEHPPLYTLLLTPISWVTDNNDFALRWLGIATGTLTVLVVMLLARRVAGERAGVLAGVLAAVYPNLWIHDALIMSESLAALLVSLVLLVAVRELQSPRVRVGAAWLGGLCGLAALTRGELIMLLPFVAVPVVWATQRPIASRIRSVGVVLGCFAIVVGPWVVYNLSRFEEPVFISSNFDLNLRGSSCPESLTSVQRGALGFCVYLDPAEGADESVRAKQYRSQALDDIRDHLDEYPLTVAARIGRTWSVYAPGFELDVGYAEGRPRVVSLAGMAALWLSFPLLVLGFARVPDRRVRALFGVPILITLLPMLVSYGQMRYRIAAEPVIVVMVAIGITGLLERVGRLGRQSSTPSDLELPRDDETLVQPGWKRVWSSNLPTYFGLAGLAIAQPVLNFFDRNPRVVADSAVGGPGLVFAVLFVLMVPAVGLWAAEVALRRFTPIPASAIGGVAVGITTSLAVLVSTPADFGPPIPVECAIAVAIGVAAGLAWARVAMIRQWTRFFAVFPVVLAAQFLIVTPPVSWSGDEPNRTATATAEMPIDVVMVIFDQLPLDGLLDGNGRIDRELFPNFANLADRSTWYRNTTTVAPNTEAAVPALLTGVIPSQPGRPPTAAEYPDSVFGALQPQYRVNAWETVTSLCESNCGGPARSSTGGGVMQLLGDGLAAWNDALFARSEAAARNDFLSGDWASGPPPATRVRQFVRALDSEKGPRLDYLHVMLPHHPWRYSADGTEYSPGFDVEGLGLDLRWQSSARSAYCVCNN